MIQLRSCAMLLALACLLALVLPFCVPSADAKVFLPGGGDSGGDRGDGLEAADPDDIAVNSLPGVTDTWGSHGFGDERCEIIWTGEYVSTKEAQGEYVRRGKARLLWIALFLRSQLAFAF